MLEKLSENLNSFKGIQIFSKRQKNQKKAAEYNFLFFSTVFLQTTTKSIKAF